MPCLGCLRTPEVCKNSLSGGQIKRSRVESAPERRSGRHGDVATTTSSSSALGSGFGRKRCAASAHRPICIPDRCRLLCARSAHCLNC
eukprot:1473842-Prymnesium_polylepis.1